MCLLKNWKKCLPKLIYFCFFASLSSLAAAFCYFPLYISHIFKYSCLEGVGYLLGKLPCVASMAVLVVLLILTWQLIGRIKRWANFFGAALVILMIAYAFYFQGVMRFMAAEAADQMVAFVVFGLVYLAYLAWILTYFWERVIRKGRRLEAYLLLVPLVFNIVLVVSDTTQMGSSGSSFLLGTYSLWGEWFRINLGLNIYFLDFNGFAVIFLSLVSSLMALGLNGLWRLSESLRK